MYPISTRSSQAKRLYKKKWLEAVRVSTVRSDTTKHKFSTLPIGLYQSEPPPYEDFNFLSFFRGGNANTLAANNKVMFYKGSVFATTQEEDMLIVTNADFHDGTRSVPAEAFTQDREDCLQFNWRGTETVNLESCRTTSIPAFSMAARASFVDGIRLNEGQFEEIITNRSNTVNTYTSLRINEDLAPESESDSDDEVPEQIARCNFPGRSRSNRILKTPARLYDYF